MLLIRVVIVRKGQSIDSIPQKEVGHLTKLQTTQYQFSLFKKGKDAFQEKIKNEESQFRRKRSKKIQLRLSIALMYGHQGLALFQKWLAFIYCLANSVEIHFYKLTALGTDFFLQCSGKVSEKCCKSGSKLRHSLLQSFFFSFKTLKFKVRFPQCVGFMRYPTTF